MVVVPVPPVLVPVGVADVEVVLVAVLYEAPSVALPLVRQPANSRLYPTRHLKCSSASHQVSSFFKELNNLSRVCRNKYDSGLSDTGIRLPPTLIGG